MSDSRSADQRTEADDVDGSSQVHELRNIVNAISMNTEVAKLKMDTAQSNEDIKENLNRILNECRKFSSIVASFRQSSDGTD